MGTASFVVSMAQNLPFLSWFSFIKLKGVDFMKNNNTGFTIVGTNIEEVKQLNNQSGLSYNEVKKLLGQKHLQSKRQKQ
jgi:predicted NAD/FAD-binding protein